MVFYLPAPAAAPILRSPAAAVADYRAFTRRRPVRRPRHSSRPPPAWDFWVNPTVNEFGGVGCAAGTTTTPSPSAQPAVGACRAPGFNCTTSPSVCLHRHTCWSYLTAGVTRPPPIPAPAPASALLAPFRERAQYLHWHLHRRRFLLHPPAPASSSIIPEEQRSRQGLQHHHHHRRRMHRHRPGRCSSPLAAAPATWA